MPEIDLSALSGPELRRLLKVAHSRHNGALADRLEWEIAARAGAGHGPPAPPSPHLDDSDEPDFRMTAPEPGPFAPEPEPFALERWTEAPAPAGRGLLLIGVGVIAGSLLSGAAFWGLSGMDMSWAPWKPSAPRAMAVRPAQIVRPAPAPAPHAADQVAAALAPGPFPPRPEPIAPQPQPDPAPVPAEAPPPAPVEAAVPVAKPPVEIPKAPAKLAVAKKEPAPRTAAVPKQPPPAVRLAKAEPAPRKAPAPRDACGRATPADRLVCNDLGLRLMDVELREAYVRALNARADPVVLGEDQAAWRRTRDQVADPDRLERLYDQRIRELDAAAAAARAGRSPE